MSVQGIEYEELAERFGTPLYVYDGDVLSEAIAGLRRALHPKLEFFYSLKANPNISVFDVLRAGGARAEVSSLVELRTALAAGAEPENIIFLGPGKSERELIACLEAGIYAIVCESFAELDQIERLAAARDVRQRVLLRVNPEVAIGGSRLTMGGKPRQFGIDEAQVLSAGNLAKKYSHADVAGVQVYLGTRILDAEVVGKNTRYILDLADRVADSTGIRLDTVDIGGGLGVAYFDGEQDIDPADIAAQINPQLEAFAASHPDTRLIMESGRYLAGRSGTYVIGVRYVKESMGERFAVADGGTHHHMAAVGIGSFVKRNFPAGAAEPACRPGRRARVVERHRPAVHAQRLDPQARAAAAAAARRPAGDPVLRRVRALGLARPVPQPRVPGRGAGHGRHRAPGAPP